MPACREENFVDSARHCRFVALAAAGLALAGVNLLFVTDRLANSGPAFPRHLWLYCQYSLDFAVLATAFYVVSFLAWFHRAYKNLPALSGDATDMHILWVFAGWVLPVINLLFPYLLLREIGRKSAGPEGPRPSWSRSLLLWWLLCLFSQSLLAAYWQFIATVGVHAAPETFAAVVGPRLPEIALAHSMFAIDAGLSGWLAAATVAMQRRRRDNPWPRPEKAPPAKRTLYY